MPSYPDYERFADPRAEFVMITIEVITPRGGFAIPFNLRLTIDEYRALTERSVNQESNGMWPKGRAFNSPRTRPREQPRYRDDFQRGGNPYKGIFEDEDFIFAFMKEERERAHREREQYKQRQEQSRREAPKPPPKKEDESDPTARMTVMQLRIKLAELAGVEWPTGIENRSLYKRAQRKCHPDTGGSHDEWLLLQNIANRLGLLVRPRQ